MIEEQLDVLSKESIFSKVDGQYPEAVLNLISKSLKLIFVLGFKRKIEKYKAS